MEHQYFELPPPEPIAGVTSLRVAFTGTLSSLLKAATPKIAEDDDATLPTVESVVAEARKTIKGPAAAPPQTAADRARVRNLRALPEMIAAAEKDFADTLNAAQSKSEDRLSTYRTFAESAVEYEDATSRLAELKEAGVQIYLAGVADRNVEISQARREAQLRRTHEREYATAHFPWYEITQRLVSVVRLDSFSEHCLWRRQLHDAVTELEEIATSPKDDGGMGLPKNPQAQFGTAHVVPSSDLPLFMRRFVRDVNSFTAKQTLERLGELEDRLMDHEGNLSEEFRTIRESTKAATLRLRQAEVKWSREHGGETPAGRAHAAVDAPREELLVRLRRAKANLPTLPPEKETVDVSGDAELDGYLRDMALCDTSRGREAAVATDYHRILTWCSQHGNWKGALRVYRSFTERRIPASYPTTFVALLVAAKNASPRPASSLVVPVLEEAEACGFAPTRELYHSAIDVCRQAGNWRQALSLFNRMVAGGIDPTTHTYALLEQAGAKAFNTEAAEVFTAMTYAGVPAYLSYTAAGARALNRVASDTGPIADWLGSSVLPPTNAGLASKRAALLATGRSTTTGRVYTEFQPGAISRGSRYEKRGATSLVKTAPPNFSATKGGIKLPRTVGHRGKELLSRGAGKLRETGRWNGASAATSAAVTRKAGGSA